MDRVRPYGSPQPVDIPPTGYNANGYYGGGGDGGVGGMGGMGGYGGAAPGGYDGGTYDPGNDGNIWSNKMNVIRIFFPLLTFLNYSLDNFSCVCVHLFAFNLNFGQMNFVCTFVRCVSHSFYLSISFVISLFICFVAFIEIAFVAVGWSSTYWYRSRIARKSGFIAIGNG